MVLYAFSKAGPNRSAAFFSHGLMYNTIVKMFLLDSWAQGAGCTNEYAVFLISLLHSVCSSIIESDRSKGKYIRYTPEDLERMLGEFFEGKTRVDQRK